MSWLIQALRRRVIASLSTGFGGLGPSIGVLALRLVFGGVMAFVHGWGKLSQFSQMASQFPDPLGVGSQVSLGLTVFAEFFCALGVTVGLLTRLAAFALSFTMGVACFVVNAGASFADREMSLLFFAAYLAILFLGPGRFSLDTLLGDRHG